MYFLSSIVISEKIQYKNFLLKFKSFGASFGVHSAVLAGIVYFMSTHPVLMEPQEERVIISLSEFASTTGDRNMLEHSIVQKQTPKSITVPKAKTTPSVPNEVHTIAKTTPERMPSLTPSVSSEASAPLAPPVPVISAPPSSLIDSPHKSVSSDSENELPRNLVSSNEIGGAALGNIRAMIEHAITYPAIARKLRIEGIVVVSFVLKPNGIVEAAKVITTSGSTLLDNKAIQTIFSLSGDYPALGKTFELSIPIAFNLHKS
ncbi:energy transducer TonB [Sulfuricurvum sp.]|uniref:energy transducer TonB n=1 Tax=Sulfuricurvum sp. TaxID=2025608 RepID=UPI0026177A75|nr:energy transducer TonB [Sulfuricurvum sp.]MDD2267281.1 energy transducer TonB [Sulfuricurvum sp.]MDD2782582.1 energy transducer TonB [Sulfuricurvum sp.]